MQRYYNLYEWVPCWHLISFKWKIFIIYKYHSVGFIYFNFLVENVTYTFGLLLDMECPLHKWSDMKVCKSALNIFWNKINLNLNFNIHVHVLLGLCIVMIISLFTVQKASKWSHILYHNLINSRQIGQL